MKLKPLTDQQIIDSVKILEANSSEEIVALIVSGGILPETAVQIYPQNKTIVQAAYLISNKSIRYADRSVINMLGQDGMLDKSVVARVFSVKVPSEQVLRERAEKIDKLLAEKKLNKVKKLISGFWFQCPPELTKERISEKIVADLDKYQSRDALYQFAAESGSQQIHWDLHGPNPKSKETYELENLVRMMMQYGNFEIERQGKDELIVFTQQVLFFGEQKKTKFNWTQIIHKANFRDIVFNEDDFKLFERYLNNNFRKRRDYRFLDKEKTKNMPESLSWAEMQAIHIYTGEDHSDMNNLMRNKPEIIEEPKQDFRSTLIHCALCASGLRKGSDFLWSPSASSIRGIEFEKNMLEMLVKKAANHEIVQMDGFVSSVYNDPMSYYALRSIRISIRNIRGLYVADISVHPIEQEYLLSTGHQFRVLNYKQINGSHCIDVELVDVPENDFIPIVMIAQHPILKNVQAKDLISLINNEKISPRSAVSHFFNANLVDFDQVILAAYRKDPSVLGSLSAPEVLRLCEEKSVSFDHVRSIFGKDPRVMRKNWDIDDNRLLRFFSENFVKNSAFAQLFSNRFIVSLSEMSEAEQHQVMQKKVDALELLPGRDFDFNQLTSVKDMDFYSQSFIEHLQTCLENRFCSEKSVSLGLG
jgi:hypothetical protein